MLYRKKIVFGRNMFSAMKIFFINSSSGISDMTQIFYFLQNNNILKLNALFLYENSVAQETVLHNSFVFSLTLSSSSIVHEFYISYLIDIGSISHVNFARNDNVTLRKCLFASLTYTVSPRSFCQLRI